MDFYGLEQARYIRKPLNLLDDWCRKRDSTPDPVIKNDGFLGQGRGSCRTATISIFASANAGGICSWTACKVSCTRIQSGGFVQQQRFRKMLQGGRM